MKPWHINDPQAFQELKRQIESKYATLCVFVENDVVYIRGGLIIEAPDGRELDHYSIEIQVLDNYPKGMPIVREIGERLPKNPDRHFSPDGTACLFLEEERYKYYPQNSTIIDFIEGPVKSFFLWQTDYDLNNGKSSFEGRGHGVKGIIEFYSEELKTNNISIIYRFVDYLSAKKIKVNWKCYCGSGKQLKDCHLGKLQDLRTKIARGVAKKSFNQIKAERLKQNNIGTSIPNL
jgi:hypothetical protein